MSQETPIPVTRAMIESWASDGNTVAAIVLRHGLQPAEGEGSVVFPPTYAKIGYNVSTLADGTQMCVLDTVASQSNRLEPVFAKSPLKELVPQFDIHFEGEYPDSDDKKKPKVPRKVSLFAVGHRTGDALVRHSKSREGTDLAEAVRKAFRERHCEGWSLQMAKVAPTSLIFGVWDSRASQVKVPRILQSVIRAWDVSVLNHAVNYVPPINYRREGILGDKPFGKQKEEGDKEDKKAPASKIGIANALDDGKKGGVIVHGEIRRDLTINLLALRKLRGADEAETSKLREYVLALTLYAATEPFDGDLRSGCLLVTKSLQWSLVRQDGERESIAFDRDVLLEVARAKADKFEIGNGGTADLDGVKLARSLANASKRSGNGVASEDLKDSAAEVSDDSDDGGDNS